MISDSIVARLQQVAACRYDILEEIGRGGMGVVYRAEDRELRREVALKVLNVLDLEEARALASLEHPGIIPVHDSGTLPDGRVYYAMKLVRGTTLRAWRDSAPPDTTSPQLLRVFQRICEPVAFAHSRGAVHRDLKPQNIMIGEFGEVLVLDWGVAGLSTFHYAPPEGTMDCRADVFALGRILEFLLAGRTLPRAVRSICAKATAADPAQRYQDAGHLARDIASYLDGLVVEAHPERPWERAARFVTRYRVWVGLAVTYLLVRVILILWPR
jgi:serine/threonine protein kinase